MQKIKQFILKLLNENDPTSSKRFAGLVILFTTICLAITATVKSHGVCPDSMFNSLLIFGAGCFGLNAAEKIFKKEDKVDTPDGVSNQQ